MKELPSELRRLLYVNSVCYIVFIYIGIFVNLYIWEMHRSVREVAWYNMVLFLVWPIGFAAASQLMTRFTIRWVLFLSSVFGAVTFLTLSLLHTDNTLFWIAMVAVPTSIMWSFFSAVLNLCIPQYGKGATFGNFFSITYSVVQVLNMTVPIASALLIERLGYVSSFIMMLCFISLMIASSFKLPKFSLQHLEGKERWKDLFRAKTILRLPGSGWTIASAVTTGVFLQFQALFAMLFTFMVAGDRLTISFLNSTYTICTILALLVYRKFRRNHIEWIVIGLGLAVFGFVVVAVGTPTFFIISNILTTVGLFYFSNSWNSVQFITVSMQSGMQQARLLVWREGMICVGRIVMLLFVFAVQDPSGGNIFWLMLFAVASMATIPIFEWKAQSAEGSQSIHKSDSTEAV